MAKLTRSLASRCPTRGATPLATSSGTWFVRKGRGTACDMAVTDRRMVKQMVAGAITPARKTDFRLIFTPPGSQQSTTTRVYRQLHLWPSEGRLLIPQKPISRRYKGQALSQIWE